MRFRICGGLDAPDWVLAQTAELNALPEDEVRKLAAESARMILKSSQRFEEHQGGDPEDAQEDAKVGTLDDQTEVVVDKSSSGSSLNDGAVKSELQGVHRSATQGLVDFIVESSCKYSVCGQTLVNELTQLGLSNQAAIKLDDVIQEQWTALQRGLRLSILRIARPAPREPVRSEVLVEDRSVKVSIPVDSQEPITFSASQAKLALLVEELSHAVNTAARFAR